jgi:alpha-tubulin suppressor-like RCC1 family protein
MSSQLKCIIIVFLSLFILFSIYLVNASLIREIAASNWHSCALLMNGSVMCWGGNPMGQLGDGTNSDDPSNYVVIVYVAGDYTFKAIDVKSHQSCGTLINGSIMCWGSNEHGQLGDGTKNNSNVPILVSVNYSFTSVSLGSFHSCGLLSNGSVMCWGDNRFRQLGDGTYKDNSSVPVYVAGGYNFTSISVGNVHSCGLLVNGSAMCWGSNNQGRCGIGNRSLLNRPEYVLGGYNFTSISCGGYHSCGILFNSSLLCWGANEYGQLGNGDISGNETNRIYEPLPVPVFGQNKFSSISCGYYHSCGILFNGSLMCWGNNEDGQLGDGTNKQSSIPVFVSGDHVFKYIHFNGWHSCGILNNSSAMCWGLGNYGQLGNGDTIATNVPVYVRIEQKVTLIEVIDLINRWLSDEVPLSDVIDSINGWVYSN